jgi:hypothetical protein
MKFDVHNHNRNVVAGTRETVTDDARPVDIILSTLVFIEIIVAIIVAFNVPSLMWIAVLLGLISSFTTMVLEISYFYWSRFQKLPPKEILIFVAIIIYLTILLILSLNESPLLGEAIFAVFLIAGIATSICGILSYNKIGKCKIPVSAICVNIETEQRIATDSDGCLNMEETHTRPVFRFNYKGEDLIVKKDYYESTKLKVGDKAVLYINPNNPHEFRYQKETTWKMLLELGILFIISWIFMEVFINCFGVNFTYNI